MCGIAGIFQSREATEIDRDLVAKMTHTLYHRGPDEFGTHFEPGLGFGHRRLSIIDLAAGQQPMHSGDGSVVVIYNGEIYNFPQLTQELQALGCQFKTHCDTEVILHAWQQWGEACVEHFRGMFAFALWDRPRQTLFLARDRLGIKPLYYAELADGQLLFGSELKALLCHPQLPKEIDPTAVEEYFAFGYVPEPKSILKAVKKLSPGHTLRQRRGEGALLNAYWDVQFNPTPVSDERSAGEELIARLREAVEIRMIAEVPLGAFLSGGVDSSAVVAMMAQQSQQPVKTCSIGFGDPRYDESRFAAVVAERYGTDHRVEQVNPNDFDLIDKLATLYDEPYADSSAMPTYRVCELARKDVVVALSGDGGDENLAGYRRYRWHINEEQVRSKLPLAMRRPLFGLAGQLYPKLDWAPRYLRAKTTLQALARGSLEAYFHSVSITSNGLRRDLFSPQFAQQQLQGYHALEVFRRHAKSAPTDDPLALVQYLDYKTYLVGDILTKVDRASMAHSLEVRVPILDHKLVEWIAGLPSELKLKGREGKYLFKRALEPYLPQEIMYRPKMGFAVPLAHWFRGPLKEKVTASVLGERLSDSGIFNRQTLERMVADHQSGRREYSAPLWSLLMFDAFLKRL